MLHAIDKIRFWLEQRSKRAALVISMIFLVFFVPLAFNIILSFFIVVLDISSKQSFWSMYIFLLGGLLFLSGIPIFLFSFVFLFSSIAALIQKNWDFSAELLAKAFVSYCLAFTIFSFASVDLIKFSSSPQSPIEMLNFFFKLILFGREPSD